MITTLKDLLSREDTQIEETPYCKEQKEMLDFSIVSGDFYEIKYNRLGEKKLRFKNTVNISDFEGIKKRFPLCHRQSFRIKSKRRILQQIWENYRKH